MSGLYFMDSVCFVGATRWVALLSRARPRLAPTGTDGHGSIRINHINRQNGIADSHAQLPLTLYPPGAAEMDVGPIYVSRIVREKKANDLDCITGLANIACRDSFDHRSKFFMRRAAGIDEAG